jgi:hypothetical protein
MSGIFSKPKVPEPAPPAVMPDPEDPSIRERQRRVAMDMLTRAGRRNSILSQAGAEGGTYSGHTLAG